MSKPRGRPRGAVNKSKLELRDLARDYSEVALKTLVEVCRRGDSDSSRVSAANAILDRGYGKPLQGIQIEADSAPLPVSVDWGSVPTSALQALMDARVNSDEEEDH